MDETLDIRKETGVPISPDPARGTFVNPGRSFGKPAMASPGVRLTHVRRGVQSLATAAKELVEVVATDAEYGGGHRGRCEPAPYWGADGSGVASLTW
jgi:hypothetical protein